MLDNTGQARIERGKAPVPNFPEVALQTLTAPLAGTVQQLAVHTVGGVVTEAQPLMLLVPDDSPIEVEAMVPNKDIGFVHEGREAMVKVETFNFTKYGFVRGRVRKVSPDAVADEKHGLVYTAHVMLNTTTMRIDGKGDNTGQARIERGKAPVPNFPKFTFLLRAGWENKSVPFSRARACPEMTAP
ncbi:MAG: HlyD family efflux transporter periplasmic adaptor subunit [Gammaproteobacteria bacterium]|nr:HlyD family efflux transporter periplasmic adaptor subunit [Gammaproteobacteria bacterium]